MRFLHGSNLLHRDLKSPNVLVDSDGKAKIADFGLSAFYATQMTHMTNVAGTAAWSAPEVLKGEDMRGSADVYSFGVILWEIVTGDVPWAGKTALQVITLVALQDRRLEMPTGVGSTQDEVALLYRQCVDVNSESRPSFEMLFQALHRMLVLETQKALNLSREPPTYFLCPISMEVMRNPTICVDGHSYEQSMIEDWLASSNRSPMTNLVLPNQTLIPNRALKEAIASFVA
jgi:serine/threonine protein kinase